MRMNQPFVLNNRFVVNPALNSLNDQIMGQDTRLEPRLMNVLCFLAVNAGQLVSRQQLIKEVWNDYGGADEGLNQVISFLRKLLDDPDKKIIKTIPTKGYLLNATITDTFITEGKTTNETSLKNVEIKKDNRKITWITASVLIVIIATIFYWFWPSGNDTLPVLSVKPMPNIKTEVKPNLTTKPMRNLPSSDTLKTRDSI
jgi:DNA-binding winged helix-turn-helix (wHTH) protein